MIQKLFREKSTGRVFQVKAVLMQTVLLMHEGLIYCTRLEGFHQAMEPV
jgi:non-ribosomal peptide synthetase component E (peptide arylation enzyme)